jgi:hypothetical protein
MITPAFCRFFNWAPIKELSCRTGALRGPHPLRGESTGFALGLPMVGTIILDRNQRERQLKGYTHHEVIAPRVVGSFSQIDLYCKGDARTA